MIEFYHNLITEKSFQLLQDFRRKYRFILIGGWAVFLYAGTLKSKDIDVIVDYKELEKLKKEPGFSKNGRLKKYEIKTGEVDIDIYLPHFSNLGLPVEEVIDCCQSRQGFTVPIPEVLLVLKIYAYLDRKNTAKGNKDVIDIFSLIDKTEIDWKKYQELIRTYKLENLNQEFKRLIAATIRLPEAELSDHEMAKLKKRILASL